MGGESEEERKHGIKWNTRPSVVEGSSSKTSPSPAPWSGEVLPRPWRLPSSWRKPSTRASWICTSVLIPRVTLICATSLRPSILESRWMESSPSETGSSRSSALETALASILLTRRSDRKSPFVFLHPIGKLINSRQNFLLSFQDFYFNISIENKS